MRFVCEKFILFFGRVSSKQTNKYSLFSLSDEDEPSRRHLLIFLPPPPKGGEKEKKLRRVNICLGEVERKGIALLKQKSSVLKTKILKDNFSKSIFKILELCNICFSSLQVHFTKCSIAIYCILY